MATATNILLNEDCDYSSIEIERVLEQSEGRSGGHPVKHDIDLKALSSNPYALLEDSERSSHSLTSHEDQVEIVQKILNSKLGKEARSILLEMFHRDIPSGRKKRVVLHATNLLLDSKVKGHSFKGGEYKGVSKSKAATIVVEVLYPGRELHVQTAYAEDEIPPQAIVLANGNDYFYLEAGSDPYSGGSADDCVRFLEDNKVQVKFFKRVGKQYIPLTTTTGKGGT